ncbi:MAG: hypothetical protein QOH21_189, partial [Acidobacteriota bacterium]|nr:hypothetical protein [Acidobacteriota bacterium]
VISAPTGAYPYPYYPAYRPWGFGLFVPFFAFIFLVFLIRGMVGRGWYRRGGCGRFEEWHREMHERMKEGESTPR